MGFGTVAIVHEIPHFEDFSIDEKADTWFTVHELQQIKKSDRRLIRGVHLGAPVNNEAQGFEPRRSPIASMEKRLAIVDGIAAVLSEQGRQNSLGEFDDEAIRKQYQNATANFASQALLRGAAAAEDARQQPQDDRFVAASEITPVSSPTDEVTETRSRFNLKRKPLRLSNTRKALQRFLMRGRDDEVSSRL